MSEEPTIEIASWYTPAIKRTSGALEWTDVVDLMSEDAAHIAELEAQLLHADIVIGRLNGGEELQALMKTNNALAARYDEALERISVLSRENIALQKATQDQQAELEFLRAELARKA